VLSEIHIVPWCIMFRIFNSFQNQTNLQQLNQLLYPSHPQLILTPVVTAAELLIYIGTKYKAGENTTDTVIKLPIMSAVPYQIKQNQVETAGPHQIY